MSVTAPESGQERPKSVYSDDSNDDLTTTTRLQLLEKEYRQLSSLFHDVLAKYKHDEQQEKAESDVSTRPTPILPTCEITYLSAAEWRAIEYRSVPRSQYSLLTVGSKGRGESASWHQTRKAHHDAGRATFEISVEPGRTTRSSNENAYRMILNGRAELMEVLGEMFNSQTSPGYYIWLWPFKQLIRYGYKVRARLNEEEARLQAANGQPRKAPFQSTNDPGTKPNSEFAYTSCEQSNGISLPDQSIANERKTSLVSLEAGRSQDDRAHGLESKRSYKTTGLRDEEGHTDATQDLPEPLTTEDKPTEGLKAGDNASAALLKAEPESIMDTSTTLRDELRCLVHFMDTEMKDIFAVQKGIEDGTRTTIAFDYLWLLFKPGDLVIRKGERQRAYIVLHTCGGRAVHRSAQLGDYDSGRGLSREDLQEKEAYLAKYPNTSPFVLDCFYLDFDGTNFGPLPEKVLLSDYEGEVPINSLDVFPLRYDDNPKRTEKALIKRGKRFVKLARVDHKYYSGKTVKEPIILENPGEVNGEIIIDFGLAIKKFRKENEERSNYKRWIKEWDLKFRTGVIATPTRADERESGDYQDIVSTISRQWMPTYDMEDATFDNEIRADFIDRTSLLEERPYHEHLSSEALMLLPPRVYGFSLLDRKWYAFDLSKVDDIKDTSQGFEQLVLPPEHKKIMQALVQHHTIGPGSGIKGAEGKGQDFSMDIIRGKGRGLIILLHGVPGVGKTSTAECVAAQTKRPLFPITCGDIGTYPRDVEETLSEYFDMAHKWGCVLLLDEADVFLAKREKGGDLQRNGIVSVFLRVLEYYSGILILTTNRIGEFDEAFSSRVHIKLYYPKLDRKSTLEIWKMNLQRIADSGLDIDVREDEIKQFARKLWADSADKQTQRWNGRQIRNAFQTAIALAKWDHQEKLSAGSERPSLSVRQFEVVAKTSAHFDSYISTMYGVDEVGDAWETIASREHLRKSENTRKPPNRSAAVTGTVRGRRIGVTTQMPDTVDDDDETDSDENEEKVQRLIAELDKRQKKNAPTAKKSRDTQAGQSQKPVPQIMADDESSSNSSDENE